MIELIVSIYITAISLLMGYQSFARVYATTDIPFIRMAQGQTQSVVFMALVNISLKWGIVFGTLGIIFIWLLYIANQKSPTPNSDKLPKFYVAITAVYSILTIFCLL